MSRPWAEIPPGKQSGQHDSVEIRNKDAAHTAAAAIPLISLSASWASNHQGA